MVKKKKKQEKKRGGGKTVVGRPDNIIANKATLAVLSYLWE